MSGETIQLDVMAVGAHPDDVEIACGGTLAKLAKQGFAVGIVDLTDGEPTPKSPGPEVRLAEAQRAAEALGVAVRVQLGLPNRRLFDCFEARVALAKEFRRYRPSVVSGLGDKPPLASSDHWQTVQIFDAAVFYSRLSKWDDYFDQLPVHTIQAQLYCSLAFGGLTGAPAEGHIVVDIGDTLEAKLNSVRCYATQFPPEKQYLFSRLEAAALVQGMQAGFRAGEVLYTPRPIGTRNLMQTLLGPKATEPRQAAPLGEREPA